MARQIEAYKLRTELNVDATKGTAAMKAFQKDVDGVGSSFKKLGPQIDSALKGKEAGTKFGQNFSASATSIITGSIDSLGQTIGSVLGTAIMPGIGTAVGSTVGSMIDKVAGGMTPILKQGLELNKMLERTRVEFTTFTGSAKAADEYLDNLKKFAHETGTNLNVVVDTSEKLYDLTGNLELSVKILKAATDQAADFGGSAETITKVADALGLVAEKGELATRDLKPLFKLGIDAKKYLGEATGLSEKKIGQLIAAGRIRGDVASRVIAEGIERQKGGFAKTLADQTAGGAEAKFGVGMQLAGARGTEQMMRGMGDLYRQADKLISSDTVNKLVDFLNATSGQLINLAEKGIEGGINLAQGVAEGVSGTDAFKAVGASVDTLGNYLTTSFKTFFGIESPSQLMIDKVGIPLGQGIADGMMSGFEDRLKDGNLGTDVEKRIADFFKEHAAAAIEVMKQTGIPASVTLAQAGLESGFGQSGLTRKAQNFFGIKGTGPAGSVVMRTREETAGGRSYYENAPFRAYSSATESFADHAKFLLGKRYRGALAYAGDPAAYTEAIRRAGYATDTRYTQKVTGLIGQYGLRQYDTGGAPGGPVPVLVTGFDLRGGAQTIFGGGGPPGDITGGAKSIFGTMTAGEAEQTAAAVSSFVQTITDSEPVIVDVNVASTELLKTNYKQQQAVIAMGTVTNKAITPVVDLTSATKEYSDTVLGVTKDTEKATADELIRAADLRDRLSGMIGQVAGLIPSQQVGKKRGLFSKILGIAAPFLSFIPGVGPILSTVAGAAAQAIGGNYGGAFSTVAGGLNAGGVFNPLRDEQPTTAWGQFAKNYRPPGRAFGGPVYRGHAYLVGERQAEIFTPAENGYIHPNAGGGAGAAAILAAAAELRAAVAHLNSMPAHQVVTQGARGLVRAMDRDAGLIRLVSQRQRLA